MNDRRYNKSISNSGLEKADWERLFVHFLDIRARGRAMKLNTGKFKIGKGNTFSHSVIRLWNSLPQEFVEAKDVFNPLLILLFI